jgi:hypothetical protein
MEYRRAYWDERIDDDLVRRHEREIFPLMRRRKLFSGAENFALYDFTAPEGWVDENVFAYSNRFGDQRALILYNNAYNSTRGRVQLSTAINIGAGDEKTLVRRGLAEALGLRADQGVYYTFRDYQAGMWYLRSGQQLAAEGLYAELHAYQYHAFLDWREIHDGDGAWAELSRRLAGYPVADIDEAYREMLLDPVLLPFREIMNAAMLKGLAAGNPQVRLDFVAGLARFLTVAGSYVHSKIILEDHLKIAAEELNTLPLKASLVTAGVETAPAAKARALLEPHGMPLDHITIAWITVHHLADLQKPEDGLDDPPTVRKYLDEWLLHKVIRQAFREYGADETEAHFDALLVSIVAVYSDVLLPEARQVLSAKMQRLFEDPAVGEFLNYNRYDGALWLNKERLERLVAALFAVGLVRRQTSGDLTDHGLSEVCRAARRILENAERAGYQLDKLAGIFGAPETSPH